MSREMFSQKKSGTLSPADLLYDAVFVMHGLKDFGGNRQVGLAMVIREAVENENHYDLASIEVVWFTDWIKHGKRGYFLKRGFQL